VRDLTAVLHTGAVEQTSTELYSAVLYRERLRPGPGWWAVVAGGVAMISLAYGSVLGSLIGWAVAAGTAGLAVIGFWRASPLVTVTSEGVKCGSANLPAVCIGGVDSLDRAQLQTARRGRDERVGDRAYQVLPAWMSAHAVLIRVTEQPTSEGLHEIDPHSAWIIGTRHPEKLLQAIAALEHPLHGHTGR
jgi:hypothetical protein